MERRIITTDATEEDERIENTLRPQCLKDYVGQEKLKSKRPWRGSLPMKWEPG